MKIVGNDSSFANYIKEPVLLFSYNDVILGVANKPKLYLHIYTNVWPYFTGFLRELLLPWRWKVAYLDREDGSKPVRILVCTSGKFSERLTKLVGKPLLVANLIEKNCYDEIFGKEFLRFRDVTDSHKVEVSHPFGKFFEGSAVEDTKDLLCPIFRERSLFSLFKYYLLRTFSTSWIETTIRIGEVSAKVLIKRSDQMTIFNQGLIPQLN